MPDQLTILGAMPDASDFYEQYWGQRPFVARSVVPSNVMDSLITADELAGLSCDGFARSRMVIRDTGNDEWHVKYGPFQEAEFDDLPASNWSLLVRNVEQFHPGTARLLQGFGFSPRWLLDDIMVSFAAPGGTVGPHVDSYHVFLVQGRGNRCWRVANQPLDVDNEKNREGIDLKILMDDFSGESVDVGVGDVIYLPPRFAHEGIAVEASITYSVGFLGPRLSDLFMGFGQYLHDQRSVDQPYAMSVVHGGDHCFDIAGQVTGDLKSRMMETLSREAFEEWLCEHFSRSGTAELSLSEERDDPLSVGEIECRLINHARLHKPPNVKLAVYRRSRGGLILGAGGQVWTVVDDLVPLVDRIASERPFSLGRIPAGDQGIALITELYNLQVLEFV